MEKQNPTCAVTGEKSNLTMHAFRDDSGNMIGWIFLTEEISKEIDEFKITVKTEWNKLTTSAIIIGRAKLDNL